MTRTQHNGFAIALAWPETYCKQPGAWYDGITGWLGINKNNYYRVGHAAVVLVDTENSYCHYFDFGRYHAPFQHGRVRGSITDHELEFSIEPKISNDGKKLENYREILNALQSNKACHGEGELHASYCAIDFQKAWSKAIQMQKTGPIPYGPFKYVGSNCSRFVNTIIRSGNPDRLYKFKLNFKIPFTPTPISNIKALANIISAPKVLKTIPFNPLERLDKAKVKNTLQAPIRNPIVPDNAQWLSGEGAGSWFSFRKKGTLLEVIRYSPEGEVECSGFYKHELIESIKSIESLKVTYPSNCWEVSLENSEKQFTMLRVGNS